MDILRSVLGGAAGSYLSDRIKKHADRLADPIQHLEPQGSNEILCEIRDAVYAYLGQIHPAMRAYRTVVTLFAYPNGGYIVDYEGRTRMNVQVAADSALFIDGRLGTFTLNLKLGWNNVDLQDGSRLYVVNGQPNKDIYVEYANYAHGNSI